MVSMPYSDYLETSFSMKRKLRSEEDDHHSEGKLRKFQEDDDNLPGEDMIELSLSTTPLPLDWQRCLDIKSGKIHFYNMRTHKRTSEDPRMVIIRRDPDIISPSPPPNLDLELNLSCTPPCRSSDEKKINSGGGAAGCMTLWGDATPTTTTEEEEEEEMIATVCRRCHMLVIISKAAMTCPSCKFVHPPESSGKSSSSSSTALVRPSLKLLC